MTSVLPLAMIGPTEALIIVPIALVLILAFIVAPIAIWIKLVNIHKTQKQNTAAIKRP